MPDWLIWAIAAVLLSVGEIFTPGLFFLGPVAVAAVIAGALGSQLGSRHFPVRTISIILAIVLVLAGCKLIFTN